MMTRAAITIAIIATFATEHAAGNGAELGHAKTCAHPISTRHDAERVFRDRAKAKFDPHLPITVNDHGTMWQVVQYTPPIIETHGEIETVTTKAGGGGPEMTIDKCTGNVPITYSR